MMPYKAPDKVLVLTKNIKTPLSFQIEGCLRRNKAAKEQVGYRKKTIFYS
jgi:hypothetical protein